MSVKESHYILFFVLRKFSKGIFQIGILKWKCKYIFLLYSQQYAGIISVMKFNTLRSTKIMN